jgi:hypothetical protein
MELPPSGGRFWVTRTEEKGFDVNIAAHLVPTPIGAASECGADHQRPCLPSLSASSATSCA